MNDLVAGDLTISVRRSSPDTIEVVWTGKSNDREPSKLLDPFFVALLANAREAKASVEMHFDRLEHFNSSTITSIIALVQRARACGTKLVLVFDKALKWQKLSFDALRVLGRDDGLLEIRSV